MKTYWVQIHSRGDLRRYHIMEQDSDGNGWFQVELGPWTEPSEFPDNCFATNEGMGLARSRANPGDVIIDPDGNKTTV